MPVWANMGISALDRGRYRTHVLYRASIETSQSQEEVKAMVCDSLLKTTDRDLEVHA